MSNTLSVALIMNIGAKWYGKLLLNMFSENYNILVKVVLPLTTWQTKCKTSEESVDQKQKIRYTDFLKTVLIPFIVNRFRGNI